MMKKVLKDKFPEWTNKINKDNQLILTNDLDSLFTVAILKLLFGCQVGIFYDFKALYSTKAKHKKESLIGCDLAIEDHGIKTFCNHVTKMCKDDIVNPLSANLNNFANIYGGKYGSNYFRKYNGSTALTVLALYGAFEQLLLPGQTQLTEDQLMILACIDSYFIGAYHPKRYEAYEYFKKWQYAMGLQMFQSVFDKHSKAKFEKFQRANKLKGTIAAVNKDGQYQLHTWLDIDFLREHFPMLDFSIDISIETVSHLANTTNKHFFTQESKHDINNIFSLAVTNRDRVIYTTYA